MGVGVSNVGRIGRIGRIRESHAASDRTRQPCPMSTWCRGAAAQAGMDAV